MNNNFKTSTVSFIFKNLFVTVALLGIHAYLLHYFAKDVVFFFPIWQIYAFHFVITTLFFTLINYLHSKAKVAVFKPFLYGTLLKMGLAIVFLLPLILSDFKNKRPDVINFFIPYFLYLFFEVYSLLKFLQNEEK